MYLLLIVSTPVLMFIGYHVTKILMGGRENALPEEIVVMPQDLVWANYTRNIDVIEEISRAVVQVRDLPPLTYEQIAIHLTSKEAHRVAQAVGEFYVYREDEIRNFLLKTGQAQ
ncbi:MAG TPA: hypothetical protein VFV52_11525 [Bacilli bacterium]|nr:hypothetical protein [Bacilli bacterium]